MVQRTFPWVRATRLEYKHVCRTAALAGGCIRALVRVRTRHTRAHVPADFPTSAGSIVLMAASGTLHAPLTDSHVLHDTESALQMAVHMDGGCGGGVGCRLPCGGCHCGGRCTIQ